MPKSIEGLREAYDNVPIPEELDMVIEKNIRKARQAKRRGLFLKPLAAAAAVILVFVITVNLSPAFARYVSQVPGMESLINLISFDGGLVDVVNHGYGQEINKSATDQGITLTVENVIYDGRILLIAYEIQADSNLGNPYMAEVKLTDSKGYALPISCTIAAAACVDTAVYKSLLGYEGCGGYIIPEDVILECTSMGYYETKEGPRQDIISGNWSIPLHLDAELAGFEPERIYINKAVSVGSVNFSVDEMIIYPTSIELSMTMDSNNPVRITGFINPRMIDEDGKFYALNSGAREINKAVYSFESNYFTRSEELTFIADGVYTMPLGETYFTIDIDNECVLDDGGLGIKYVGKGNAYNTWEDREELNVRFKVTDREYQAADKKYLVIDQRVHDMLGNYYDVEFYQSPTGPSGDIEYSLGFDITPGIPPAVKVHVLYISKGIMEPVQVKLK